MNNYVQITTTTDSEELAKGILEALLNERLVACGHISSPITSSYWWKGKIDSAKEWVCVFKTRADLFPKIEGLIKSKHSYEVPEILMLPILEISQSYKDWMEQELSKS